MRKLITAAVAILISLTLPVSAIAAETEQDNINTMSDIAADDNAADGSTVTEDGRIPAVSGEEDKGKSGSLTIHYALNNGENILSGAVFSIIQTAVLSDPDAQIYSLTKTFGELDISFDGMTAEGSAEAAEKFYRYSEKNNMDADATETTGDEGDATFTGLAEGIYLVYQEGSREGSSAYAYDNTLPFLVRIPDRADEDSDWEYTVTAYPKSEPSLRPTEKPAPTARPSGSSSEKAGNVRTGDETDVSMFIFLIAASFALLIIGSGIIHRKGDNR